MRVARRRQRQPGATRHRPVLEPEQRPVALLHPAGVDVLESVRKDDVERDFIAAWRRAPDHHLALGVERGVDHLLAHVVAVERRVLRQLPAHALVAAERRAADRARVHIDVVGLDVVAQVEQAVLDALGAGVDGVRPRRVRGEVAVLAQNDRDHPAGVGLVLASGQLVPLGAGCVAQSARRRRGNERVHGEAADHHDPAHDHRLPEGTGCEDRSRPPREGHHRDHRHRAQDRPRGTALWRAGDLDHRAGLRRDPRPPLARHHLAADANLDQLRQLGILCALPEHGRQGLAGAHLEHPGRLRQRVLAQDDVPHLTHGGRSPPVAPPTAGRTDGRCASGPSPCRRAGTARARPLRPRAGRPAC